ncbi:penicillin-binding protein 2 [Algiphilus sp.]|uniref:peptidoglycan D,D-transpeptidase FtsI family protein n=1 Tax=Algiphilus sp. TaxID=1872431 RepID=UPI0032EF59E4|nr:penicillin-binding protein 2 [Algiphilus sp.]
MSRAARKPQVRAVGRWRRHLLSGFVIAGAVVVGLRAFELQVLDRAFLENESAKRAIRHVEIPANRGAIVDRNGEPLAVSAPVESLWVVPADLLNAPEHLQAVARLLDRNSAALRRELEARRDRQFYWLARHLSPAEARRITALNAPGVATSREYRRFYPAGEIPAHIVGITNIDGKGLEGVEAIDQKTLAGEPGKRRVIRARDGRVVETGIEVKPARPGQDVQLTIDLRLQYLAHRELKAAVQRHGAKSGMVVVVDARSGDILAMASSPGFNPNRRNAFDRSAMRNRAMTDLFEPGSTVKPLLVAHALDRGLVDSGTRYQTGDGWMQVGRLTVQDVHAYGEVDLTRLLKKSSNVGAAKLGLEMGAEAVFAAFDRFGFGKPLYMRFPGTASGRLSFWRSWDEVELATASYGYGLSTSALQLVRAYAALANDGQLPGLRLRTDEPPMPPERVVSAEAARQVRGMLRTVISHDGTAARAAVPGFSVAGKTGTMRKVGAGGYSADRHQGLFVGMLPAENPRLVGLVLIDEPTTGGFYGGVVAAPVFSRVMQGAAHWLQLSPRAPVAPGFTTAATTEEEPRS